MSLICDYPVTWRGQPADAQVSVDPVTGHALVWSVRVHSERDAKTYHATHPTTSEPSQAFDSCSPEERADLFRQVLGP